MCDLVTGNGDWNWKILHQWLPQDIFDKISNTQPPNGDLEADKFKLDGVAHEVGSKKYLYNLMAPHDHVNATHDCKIIWRLKVLERITNFMCLLKHDRLLND